jgi:RTX calcium-binding nonapeptide repeat (4 copies)
MTDTNVIVGTFSSDSIRGTDLNDSVLALTGNDSVRGMLGDDSLAGGIGNDRLEGDRGNDFLLGGIGNDVILGGRGNDVINGGVGSDVLTGGLDSDVFAFTALDFSKGATDVITDFRLGEDSLSFFGLKITNVTKGYLDMFAMNGEDLANSSRATDLTVTVQDVFGRTQNVILLDVWASANNSAWDSYFDSLGYSGF